MIQSPQQPMRIENADQGIRPWTTSCVESVVDGLDGLNLETNAFYIIDKPNGDYMQIGGCHERLTVEVRVQQDTGFRHFVVGHEDEPGAVEEVQCESGIVSCRHNQVMAIGDARRLVRAFCEGRELPLSGYLLEDVSHRYTKRRYTFSDQVGSILATLDVGPHALPAVLIWHGEGWTGKCAEVPVATQGRTVKETVANLREAVKLWLESFGNGDLPADER